jgi:MFS family permease
MCFGDALPRGAWIVLFILFAGLGWIGNTLASPGYNEMMFFNIAKEKRGRFSSILSLSIGGGGFAGSYLVVEFMGLFPAPRNYHLAFIVGGAVVFFSCALLYTMHDHQAREYADARKSEPLINLSRRLWNDFNFRVFLIFFSLVVAAQALAPLLISYSRDVLAAGDGGAGYFTLAYFGGTVIFGTTLPLLADRFGFRIIGIIMALIFGAGFLLPILFPQSIFLLYVSYASYAASLILSTIVLANLGHEMVPDVPPAFIIALGRTLVMPVMLAVGPLSGLLVDLHGEGGYLVAFVSGVLLNSVAVLGFVFVVREPRTGQEIFLRFRRI